jgi:hypothetical protein
MKTGLKNILLPIFFLLLTILFSIVQVYIVTGWAVRYERFLPKGSVGVKPHSSRKTIGENAILP